MTATDGSDCDADATVDPTGSARSDQRGRSDSEGGRGRAEPEDRRGRTDSEDPRGRADSTRRRVLARLGAVAGIASVAGCTGGGDGGSGNDEAGGSGDGTGSSDGQGTDGDDGSGGPGGSVDDVGLEQRAIELRAILREFEGGYEQSVLDRAEAVRRQHRESVVFLDLEQATYGHRVATGWFVTESLVLTTRRKLSGLETVPVHTVDGESHEAEIVQRHDVENLALLELNASGPPIDRSRAIGEPPEPNQPLVQIGHHDEYGHWVATVGDYLRTQTFDVNDDLIDEHWSNVHGLPGVGGAPVFDLDGDLVGTTNGVVPRNRRDVDSPRPLNDHVYDWQMSHREWFNHLDAEQTFEEIDPWL